MVIKKGDLISYNGYEGILVSINKNNEYGVMIRNDGEGHNASDSYYWFDWKKKEI